MVESTLRQMQRLLAVGQLTSGVAHDFFRNLPDRASVRATSRFSKENPAASGIDGKAVQRLSYMREGRPARRPRHRPAFDVLAAAAPLDLGACDLNARVTRPMTRRKKHDGSRSRSRVTLPRGALHRNGGKHSSSSRRPQPSWINARDAMNGGGMVVACVQPERRRPAVPATGRTARRRLCRKSAYPIPATRLTPRCGPRCSSCSSPPRRSARVRASGLSQVPGFAQQSGGKRQYSRLYTRQGYGDPHLSAARRRRGPAPRRPWTRLPPRRPTCRTPPSSLVDRR